ncbi:RCC1-like domain-containing protein [Legionella cardiaca]
MLIDNGQVYSWGKNNLGGLGLQHRDYQDTLS